MPPALLPNVYLELIGYTLHMHMHSVSYELCGAKYAILYNSAISSYLHC